MNSGIEHTSKSSPTKVPANQSIRKLRSKRSRQQTLNKPGNHPNHPQNIKKQNRAQFGSNKIAKNTKGYDLLDGEVSIS